MKRPAPRTPVPMSPHRGWRWLRTVTTLVVVAVLLGGVGWGAQTAYRALDTRVEVIGVDGPMHRVSRAEVEDLVVSAIDGGFLSLDLDKIRSALEAQPWIESARVRRTWPRGLAISFVEEEPIARWGDKGFLNRSGVLLTAASGAGLENLLELAGPPGSEREVMREYRDLSELLQPSGLKVRRLALDSRGAWSAELDQGPRLLLGRDQIVARTRRFLAVWALVLQERWTEVAQVDVRYDSGFAVQWLKKTDEAG